MNKTQGNLQVKNKLALIAVIISLLASYPAYSINGSLKKRISNVDKIAKENTGKIDTNQKNIGDNSTKIGTNTENIGTNAKNIKSNSKKIDTNGENIGTNAENIKSNTKKIDINGQNIGTNAEKIKNNEIKIDSHNEMIVRLENKSSENTRSIKLLTDEFHGFESETKERFSQMGKTISKNHKKAMAGISAAMAMNAIPYIEGKSISMGLGGGSYGGQGSMAFGSQFRVSDNIKSGTYLSYDSNRNIGVAAGMSFGW